MDTLEEFCGVFGLKVNFGKFKLYVSPNVSRREANSLGYIFGMNITKDLGIYLGAPIIHGKMKKSNFNLLWKSYYCASRDQPPLSRITICKLPFSPNLFVKMLINSTEILFRETPMKEKETTLLSGRRFVN